MFALDFEQLIFIMQMCEFQVQNRMLCYLENSDVPYSGWGSSRIEYL